MPRLEGKVAIITGAASGIGEATADLFRSEGATVVAADRMEGVDVVSVDAGSEADVERLVEQTVADHGGVDIVFANAGISGGLAGDLRAKLGRLGGNPPRQPDRPVPRDQICGSAHEGARRRIDHLHGLRRRAFAPERAVPAYSASKAGVINLVKTAAAQLCDSNIRVNAICPGLIETGMTQGIYDMARAAESRR